MASYKLPPRGPGLTRTPEHQEPSAHRPLATAKVLDGNNRQTALTPEVMARLCKELAVGDWPTMAAYRAQVSPSTMFNWLRMGCLPDAVEPYTTLVSALIAIEAELHGRMFSIIMAHTSDKDADGSPEQAKWVLHNRFRYLWAVDKESGKSGGRTISEAIDALTFEHDEVRREKARAIIAALPNDAKQLARKEGFLV
jgi:hypothetical protein